MIVFKKIQWQNFLSTGSAPNIIELDQHASTLITGKNGEGKSTLLCALTFVLFGKPFRNVNKNQLINSINGKKCLVEIEFNVNSKDYVVKRGMKPNIFEIYCNGELINQDAAARDYQKVLEQQILKLNYKTFTQVVILGSATFVPFMQLSSIQRREVIEDILDIRVFSLMNILLKDRSSQTRDDIQRVESAIQNQKVKIGAQKKLIEVLETSRKNAVQSLQEQIDQNATVIEEKIERIRELSVTVAELSAKKEKYTTVADAITKVSKMKVMEATNITQYQKTMQFFNTKTTCPTCTQEIADEFKHNILCEHEQLINSHQEKFNEACSVLEKLEGQLAKYKADLDKLMDINLEISTIQNTANVLTQQNRKLAGDIETAISNTGDLVAEKARMKDIAEQAINLVEQKTELLDQRYLHEVAAALLKDTGIKTAIIKEYLPVMNKLINKYLGAMDFFVKFELDESFQEVIKSRNRDAFTYDSFSEGEKRRLDLAILFTWRQIAKMKNSVNTNIMILDEILDGALDAGGIDFFLSIMNQFGEHTNVFVISHKVDQMVERFDRVIRVEKKNDFSTIQAA